MEGLLKEKSEIEKLQREFKILSEQISKIDITVTQTAIPGEELVLEECEA
jgi:NAD/NADP transhydrogenase alpha subunit